MKTLLLALVAPDKSKGTREGAVRGLVAVGKEAVRKGLIDGGGAKVVASECQGSSSRESINLLNTTLVRVLARTPILQLINVMLNRKRSTSSDRLWWT